MITGCGGWWRGGGGWVLRGAVQGVLTGPLTTVYLKQIKYYFAYFHTFSAISDITKVKGLATVCQINIFEIPYVYQMKYYSPFHYSLPCLTLIPVYRNNMEFCNGLSFNILYLILVHAEMLLGTEEVVSLTLTKVKHLF